MPNDLLKLNDLTLKMLWNNCAYLWTVLLSTFSFFERYFSIIKLLTLARTVFKERSRRIFSLHVSLSWPHTRQVLYTVQYIISFIFYNFKIDLEWIFIFFYTAGSREISLKRRPSRTMLPGPFGNKLAKGRAKVVFNDTSQDPFMFPLESLLLQSVCL